MTLRTSLLRELVNPNLSVGGRAELCCELAKEFENKGEYDEAREVLSDLWPGREQRPRLEGLEPNIAAEVLMRAGVLTGWSSEQIADAQEKAKDLISESLTIFEYRQSKEKIAEAQTELALCYMRAGEYSNASDLLKLALTHLTTDCELKAKAVLRSGIVKRHASPLGEALAYLTENESLFEKIDDQLLKGCYHQALGDVLKDLCESKSQEDYLDRAFIEYAAASFHLEQVGHKRYLANVENNRGFLYLKINYCNEAHEHLNRARRIFIAINDRIALAQVDETRARVFLKEKKDAEAEKAACSAVRVLENSDRSSLLAEALKRHGIALARLGSFNAALNAFRRAVDLYIAADSFNRAADVSLTLYQELGEQLAIKGAISASGRPLDDEVFLLEQQLIKQALENAQGRVTSAARTLGMSYQRLTHKLTTEHKDLLTERTPARRRARKIVMS
ncbi:MAG TPA: helix-turn-helix domain-containing protein [Pyrinomonadaceae bacterium]|nr:helix-turn-helix domain-containing protein [Pyrinomonadaceae bacterium]